MRWIVTCGFGLAINVSIMCFLLWQARQIENEVTETMHAHIIRGLFNLGTRSQSLMQSLLEQRPDVNVDLTTNAELWNSKDFSSSTLRECLICCVPFDT